MKKVAFTQRYLNNQLSGNLESSAFTLTANVQTFLICRCNALICSSERVLQRCSGWILAWYRTSSGTLSCKLTTIQVVEPSPATQLPTPALKDWSSKSALMGQVLLSTPLLKSAMSGMDKMGSKPISEMGGSASGALHKRIRPSLRASRKATSVPSPLSLEAGPR